MRSCNTPPRHRGAQRVRLRRGGSAVEQFRTNYLLLSQNGAQPIDYPYYFVAPSNTGVPSGFDLDNDGTIGGPNDAFGFGDFPGQYGMVVLSRFPIVTDQARTFQNLLWSSVPGARLPDDPATAEPADWYSPDELAVLRLSSKSHWDVPIDVDGRVIHILASHPTPPAFDGPEDRNGMRNADEIGFWADYVAGTDTSWIVDDTGADGGLAAEAEFVVVGDLNSDPLDGDSLAGAIDQVLALDRVQDPAPTSDGAVQATLAQGLNNAIHAGNPALDTADFTDDAPGNLRVDYVLPSDGFDIVDRRRVLAAHRRPTVTPRRVTIDPLASSDPPTGVGRPHPTPVRHPRHRQADVDHAPRWRSALNWTLAQVSDVAVPAATGSPLVRLSEFVGSIESGWPRGSAPRGRRSPPPDDRVVVQLVEAEHGDGCAEGDDGKPDEGAERVEAMGRHVSPRTVRRRPEPARSLRTSWVISSSPDAHGRRDHPSAVSPGPTRMTWTSPSLVRSTPSTTMSPSWTWARTSTVTSSSTTMSITPRPTRRSERASRPPVRRTG